MRRLASIVEGYGEIEAAPTLIARLGDHLGIPSVSPKPIRAGEWKGLKKAGQSERYLELAHSREADVILVLMDLEDDCPVAESENVKDRIGVWKAGRDIKVELCFLVREYETIFLQAPSCLGQYDEAHLPSNPEAIRGAKERIKLITGRRYKETQDQLILTKLLDIGTALENSRSLRRLKNVLEGQ